MQYALGSVRYVSIDYLYFDHTVDEDPLDFNCFLYIFFFMPSLTTNVYYKIV